MKTKFLLPILLFFIALFFSCDSIQRGPENLTEDEFRTVEVNNDYTINLPKYMGEGELHEDASLEYQHLFKETYIVVIDENKQEAQESISYYDFYDADNSFIDNYINFQIEGFEESSTIINKGAINNVTINGLTAKQFDITLAFDDIDEDIYYLATFIESNSRIYMILHWTLKGRQGRYQDTFKTVANSFNLQQRRSKTKRKTDTESTP